MTKYDLAASLVLNSLDNFEGRMPAQQQRAVFGKVLFGKKIIRISCDGQGSIAVRYGCWEGTHTSYQWETHSFDALLSGEFLP